MRYFPAFLDLKDKLCVVVGGGRVAERKIRTLLKAGAIVRVIGPEFTGSLSRMEKPGKMVFCSRTFRKGDLKGAFLAIAATGDRGTNERVYHEASERRIPVNVVDDPSHCSFIVPSLVERGDLLVAISTSGQSPALAKWLRQKLQKEIGPEYAFILRILGAVRKKILSRGLGQKDNQKIFRQLVRENLLPLLRRKNHRGLESRLRIILGPGFSLKELGLK